MSLNEDFTPQEVQKFLSYYAQQQYSAKNIADMNLEFATLEEIRSETIEDTHRIMQWYKENGYDGRIESIPGIDTVTTNWARNPILGMSSTLKEAYKIEHLSKVHWPEPSKFETLISEGLRLKIEFLSDHNLTDELPVAGAIAFTGLPGSGKSTHAKEYVHKHFIEKEFHLTEPTMFARKMVNIGQKVMDIFYELAQEMNINILDTQIIEQTVNKILQETPERFQPFIPFPNELLALEQFKALQLITMNNLMQMVQHGLCAPYPIIAERTRSDYSVMLNTLLISGRLNNLEGIPSEILSGFYSPTDGKTIDKSLFKPGMDMYFPTMLKPFGTVFCMVSPEIVLERKPKSTIVEYEFLKALHDQYLRSLYYFIKYPIAPIAIINCNKRKLIASAHTEKAINSIRMELGI